MASKKRKKIREGWMNPPEGKVMVNVNAGCNENVGRGSVGAIIRDSSRGVIAASYSFITHCVLEEGLMLAQQIGCNRLIIQSDCMGLLGYLCSCSCFI